MPGVENMDYVVTMPRSRMKDDLIVNAIDTMDVIDTIDTIDLLLNARGLYSKFGKYQQ